MLPCNRFCWGGSQSFYATSQSELTEAFVLRHPPDDTSLIEKIACPVYGFYGGNDARVNASIPTITEMMTAAGKTYDPVIYDGAGHGFMRAGKPKMHQNQQNRPRHRMGQMARSVEII